VTGIHAGNVFTSDGTDNAGARGFGWAHYLASATGTYTPQWDVSPADVTVSSTAAFKEAGGAPPVTTPIIFNNPLRGCCRR